MNANLMFPLSSAFRHPARISREIVASYKKTSSILERTNVALGKKAVYKTTSNHLQTQSYF